MVGLVAFRLYRITRKDSITQWFHGAINAAAARSRVMEWVNELLSCAWCIGLWYSLIVVAPLGAAGLITSVAEGIIVAVGASAVCGLVERVDQALETLERTLEAATKRLEN